MSMLIRTLNLIKTHRDRTWLTPSQTRAFKQIVEALRAPGTVNLCGPVGVGKTFLTWILVDELGYVYLPHIYLLEASEISEAPGVIVDNAPSDRTSHRQVLLSLSLKGVRRAVIVTREIVQDYTRYVHMKLMPEDISKVEENLSTVGIKIGKRESRTLWELVNPALRSVSGI